MLRLLWCLLRLFGVGCAGRCGPEGAPDPEARERFEARRRLFRQKLREAADVWREGAAAPEQTQPGAPAAADPLEG